MEENVDNSGEAFLAILGLVILGSCANMSYLKEQQTPERIPSKMEQRQKITSHPPHRMVNSSFILTR